MKKHSRVIAVLVAVVAFSICAVAQDKPLRVTSIDLTVTPETDVNCKLSFNGTIHVEGKGKIWFAFEGPAGVTFDFGAEEDREVSFGKIVGVGKGASFQKDIHGTFVLKAAVVDAKGKRGPVVLSKRVPANFTCGDGNGLAAPIAPQPAPKRKNGPTG